MQIVTALASRVQKELNAYSGKETQREVEVNWSGSFSRSQRSLAGQ
jgi:hypothetical protein